MINAGIDKLFDLTELLGPSEAQLREALGEAFKAMLAEAQH